MGTVFNIKCLQCFEVLSSRHASDYHQCACPNATFVNGGVHRPRLGAVDLKLVQVLPTTEE